MMLRIKNSVQITRELLESGKLPEWADDVGPSFLGSKLWHYPIGSGFSQACLFGDHLIQYATGTIEVLTPEQFAECVCDPYEEAARVVRAEKVSGEANTEADEAYNLAIDHAAYAIRQLQDASNG